VGWGGVWEGEGQGGERFNLHLLRVFVVSRTDPRCFITQIPL